MNGDDDWSTGGLTLTGERTIPDIARENYWFRRHEAVYEWIVQQWAKPTAPGLVIEAGCGEGYGAAMLAAQLHQPVIAVDYDMSACHHARHRYPSIAVVRANLAAMPLPAGSAWLGVSLQVLEHLWDPRGFLADLRRSLTIGGSAVISTPNRLTFSPGVLRGEKPRNPFHVEEFDREQLGELLIDAEFADIAVYGLTHSGRLVLDEGKRGSIVEAQLAALSADAWPDDLLNRVAAVTTEDFAIAPATDDCLDLIAVGVRA